MHPKLIPVEHLEDLERLLEASSDAPVLLFKHSYSCGISAEALDGLLEHLGEGAEAAHYGLVTVQTHRELSNVIAARLGVRHESPQAILIHNGRAVWTASHFRVNAAEIGKAISNARIHNQGTTVAFRATIDASNRPS